MPDHKSEEELKKSNTEPASESEVPADQPHEQSERGVAVDTPPPPARGPESEPS